MSLPKKSEFIAEIGLLASPQDHQAISGYEPSLRREHTPHKCIQPCTQDYCVYCEGGLIFCTVCGGFEGSLTDVCCGFQLHSTVLEAIYKGGLNFLGNAWTVRQKNDERSQSSL